MKKNILMALLSMGIVEANVQINCDSLSGCKKKACYIEKNIDIATKMKNDSRVDGLKVSLDKVNKYCTDDKLIKDIEDKIDDAKEELKEHTKDLKEAVEEKREDNIKKYQEKIDEDNKEIAKLEQELKELS